MAEPNEKQRLAGDACPACGHPEMQVFYKLLQVPVHSVLLLSTRAEAVAYPKGDIVLGLCLRCGFVSNLAFDPGMHEYSGKYEATQGYSDTFNQFHRRLAEMLVERHDLRHRRIIEIGCGQGEFLSMLCELGDNRGLGFDPAYAGRSSQPTSQKASFVADFYSEKYAGYPADFVCCKMTLEHIQDTGRFVRTVRRAVDGMDQPVIFFQVPNAAYVFGKTAFWDIYYEHCSYFSPGALARLFRQEGFSVLDLWTDYDDQYVMIEASPAAGNTGGPADLLEPENDLQSFVRTIQEFNPALERQMTAWRQELARLSRGGRKVVLWGGGSKAVALLTTLGLSSSELEYVVDINPYKAGTFIAGTGQEIISPGRLKDIYPDGVVVMNPVYKEEVRTALSGMGLAPELVTADEIVPRQTK